MIASRREPQKTLSGSGRAFVIRYETPRSAASLIPSRSSAPAHYESEAELVSEAVACLERRPAHSWGNLTLAQEFYYRSGRTDIIALSSRRRVIAFEAKLADWRKAVHQAHRNRCFAHQSYVLLPEQVARRAMRHEAEFTLKQVGLCYLANDRIVKAIIPTVHAPWQEWLVKAAIRTISERNKA